MVFKPVKTRISMVNIDVYEFKLDYKANAFVCKNLEYLNIGRDPDQYPNPDDVLTACVQLGVDEEFVTYIN